MYKPNILLLQHLCKMCNYLSLSAAPFLLSTYLTHNAFHKISQLYFILFWFESALMFYTTAYYFITLSESRWIWWMFLYECVSPFFPSLSVFIIELILILILFLQYGDYDPNVHKPGFLSQEELLPKRVSVMLRWVSFHANYADYVRRAL